MPSTFVWSVGPVVSGSNVVVDVTSAPCSPVTLRFKVNGIEVGRASVTPPGSHTFKCPPNSTGQTWSIDIECPTSSDTQGGAVG